MTLEVSCQNQYLNWLAFLCFIINFTTSLIDDRYTHQCSDEIVMFGPAATLLAGRMIRLDRVVIKRPLGL